jgi:hypothetical protein
MLLQPQLSTTLGVSRFLLKAWLILNLATGVGLLVMLAATFPFEPVFFEFFSKKPPRIDPGLLVPTLRVWMVLALPMVAAFHILLGRLLAVVETVRSGNPFVAENAVRLKTIAWCVLVTQLLELVFGALAATVNAAGSNLPPWKFSMTGWVAVVLLYVLARVFEEGTHLRDDLEAMI